ncbi:oligosaccharide flippase family protein [Vibrio campbellii]|uniref:oligosaccharide flippase family protein n=1 Tax=Vibrio campbellii TaxID=680 RepID=UPI0005EF8FBF|nr:oligosaccharide flippase family protein [Vibrio campbellii]
MIVKSISWNALSVIISQISQILVISILARFLDKSDFGLFAILSILIIIMQYLSESGFGNFIIQYKGKCGDLEYSSLLIANVFLSILVYSIVFIISYLLYIIDYIDYFYEIITISTIVVIQSFGSIHRASLEKLMNFKVISICEVASVVLSSILGVYMALNEFGIYSLIAMTIAKSVLSTWLYILNSKIKVQLKVNFEFLVSSVRFVKFNVLNNIINHVSKSSDQLLIGRFLGSEQLGVYSIFYKLVVIPTSRLNSIVSRVMYPRVSELLRENKDISNYYLRFLMVMMFLNSLILFSIMANSQQITLILLGERWLDSTWLLHWFVLVVLFQSSLSLMGPLYLAFGRTDLGFKCQLVISTISVSIFFIGVQYDLSFFMRLYFCATIFIFLLGSYFPSKFLSIKYLKMVLFIVAPIIISYLISISIASIVSIILSNNSLDKLYTLPSYIVIFIFLGILFLGFRGYILKLSNVKLV